MVISMQFVVFLSFEFGCTLPKKKQTKKQKNKQTNNQKKEECILVGCILTAAVATTRCHYWGDLSNPPPSWGRPGGSAKPPIGCRDQSPLDTDPLYVDPPLPGCRPPSPWMQTPTPCEQNDTRFWKHYLPLRSVKKKWNYFSHESKIAFYCNSTLLSHGGIFEGRVNETVFIFAFAPRKHCLRCTNSIISVLILGISNYS